MTPTSELIDRGDGTGEIVEYDEAGNAVERTYVVMSPVHRTDPSEVGVRPDAVITSVSSLQE